MVLLTLKLSLVLAACCKVDVINGGLGLIDIGFFETSEIFNDDELINSTISLASNSGNKGSDFFLFKAKLILLLSLSIASKEISQNSSGTNF